MIRVSCQRQSPQLILASQEVADRDKITKLCVMLAQIQCLKGIAPAATDPVTGFFFVRIALRDSLRTKPYLEKLIELFQRFQANNDTEVKLYLDFYEELAPLAWIEIVSV